MSEVKDNSVHPVSLDNEIVLEFIRLENEKKKTNYEALIADGQTELLAKLVSGYNPEAKV